MVDMHIKIVVADDDFRKIPKLFQKTFTKGAFILLSHSLNIKKFGGNKYPNCVFSRPFCVSGPMRTPDPPEPWGISCGLKWISSSSSSSSCCSSNKASGTEKL